MKTTIALLLSAFAALLSGCASLRQPATDIVLTGAGGAIGYHASGKSIKGAAIGAGPVILSRKSPAMKSPPPSPTPRGTATTAP
ncbi:hypothetical protein OH491_15340 [Termitidicoccus mucosus]|uniref:hypothetical protein n=1 Tax=Termitidicoccus mucosus TaxID=1184151 RepID=UPI003184188A